MVLFDGFFVYFLEVKKDKEAEKAWENQFIATFHDHLVGRGA